MKYYRSEEYIYRVCNFRMSKNKMADLLYAGIVCRAKFTTLWSLSNNESRKNDAYNMAHIMVHIHPNVITEFEEIAGVQLKIQEPLSLNSE